MFQWIVLSSLLAFAQSAPNGRIVGGDPIDIAEIPYQVSLQDEGPYCGGTLISPVHVITAAHCTIAKSRNDIAIRIGSNRTSNGGEFITVEQIIEHPLFDHDTKDYDISIIVLRTPQTWTSDFPKLSAPTDAVDDEDWATVSGWGYTRDIRKPNNILRAVQVPIVNHHDCIELYEGVGNITDRMLCAGNIEDGGIDSCQGDSGGPLMKGGTLIGVVSWGVGCADPGHPGVYTMISAVHDWIVDTISV